MSATAIDRPVKEHANLVAFSWGTSPPKQALYTDWTSDVVVGALVYLSTPTLEVTLPANSGALDDVEPATVVLPLDAFTDAMSNGHAHAPVSVVISERISQPASTTDTTVRAIFRGRVTLGTRNWQDREGLVGLTVQSWKTLLDQPAGPGLDFQCWHTLGDPLTCKVDLESLAQTATVLAIDGQAVTLTGLPLAPDPRYWRRGNLRLDGLSISVRDWDGSVDPQAFSLGREPPPEWLGAQVRVYPGDDHTVERCRLFSNEANFGGAGHGMVDYNPNFEQTQ